MMSLIPPYFDTAPCTLVFEGAGIASLRAELARMESAFLMLLDYADALVWGAMDRYGVSLRDVIDSDVGREADEIRDLACDLYQGPIHFIAEEIERLEMAAIETERHAYRRWQGGAA
jgi:hypothetical protein